MRVMSRTAAPIRAIVDLFQIGSLPPSSNYGKFLTLIVDILWRLFWRKLKIDEKN